MGQDLFYRLESVSSQFSKTKSEMTDAVTSKQYPLNAEPALIHPLNSSTVKIRDNGMIDIFVGTDNGIRINPNERSLYFFSNTYGAKSTYHKHKVLKDKTEDIGRHWTITVDGNIEAVSKKGDIHVKAEKGAISLTSSSNRIDIDAGQRVYIEGRTMPQWLDTIRQT